MVGVAAGLAITGKVPFIGSFAEFVTGRVYDQLRQEVAYGHTNVKIASSHAGITLGEDGATHQTMEDIALMRALPGMTVIVPCDYNQTKNATVAAARFDGPVYLRFGRPSVPNFTPSDEPFEIGKIYNLNEGKDVTIIACGHLVWEALQAAEALEAEGISAEVLNVATIKPLDEKTILESIAKTGCAVVAEEHNMAGGLGEAVAGVLAAGKPAPVEFVRHSGRAYEGIRSGCRTRCRGSKEGNLQKVSFTGVRKGLLWNRIISAAAPRVTADYSFKCKPGAFERAVFAQRFEGIL